MAIPLQAIPVAISAVRSLILIGKRTEDILTERQTQAPLPVMLPPLPDSMIEDLVFDSQDMRQAFAPGGRFRTLLDDLGLADKFDADMASTGARLAFQTRRYLGLYYEARDAANGVIDASSPYQSVAPFLVVSSEAGTGRTAGKLLRMVADTLLDFLGQSAPVFLSQSRNQLLISTILREFAAGTNLEQDPPDRILKTLLGSVAAAAADTTSAGNPPSDNPLALLLFASLGKVRRDMQDEGDDFVARIISRQGFQAVVGDWLTRVATDDHLVRLVAGFRDLDAGSYDPADPSTLPAGLQPVYGALSEVLLVIGKSEAAALRQDDVFESVFKAVLDGVTDHSDALLQRELGGRKAMAELLQATITAIDTHMPDHGNPLIAPIFGTAQKLLARSLPHLSQDEAVDRSVALALALAQKMASPEFLEISDALTRGRDPDFARALIASTLELLGDRPDLLLDGQDGHIPDILREVLQAAPDLVKQGLSRDAITALTGDIIAVVLPDDGANGGFARDVMPVVLGLVQQVGQGGQVLPPKDIETLLRAYATHFGANRPVWEALIARDLLDPVILTVSAVLQDGAAPPPRLPPQTIAAILQAVLEATGRQGLALADLAGAAAAGPGQVQTLLRDELTCALTGVFARLGRGIDSHQMAPLLRVVLDQLLMQAPGQPLSDAELATLITDQIAILHRNFS